MTKQKNKAVNSIDLTKREQKFVNLLTDKLIDVAHNPKLRKGLKVEGIGLGEYYFYSNDVPSEIERIGLFFFNMLEGENNRAFFWIEQVQDAFTKAKLLSNFYAICAQNAEDNEALEYYEKYLEYAVETSEGVSCSLLQKYAQYLAASLHYDELLSLLSKVFVYGLHGIDATQNNALQLFNQTYSAEQAKLILDCLEHLKEIVKYEESDKEVHDYLKCYYLFELAYYYAVTGRITKAKDTYQEFRELYELDGDEDMYNFDGLSVEELQERNEWFQQAGTSLVLPLYNEGSQLPVAQAFGYTDLPKRPHPKKGSFDWLYNQGEKSYLAKLNHKATELDYANMRAVAEAYRTGNGVRQNLRLADCWEEMAQP